jgi:hypothetical protein
MGHSPITHLTTYDDVTRSFSWDRLWALFDGDRERMHLAHEYLNRHQDWGTTISVHLAPFGRTFKTPALSRGPDRCTLDP